MPFKFNPFTGNFDQNGSGGGGGASYIDGEVATYADLPLDGTAAINSAWLVREASGTWLLGRKPAGIYIRTATAGVSRDADYTYAGILPDVFSDANFTLYDDADSTKNAQFQLSGITTGTTRTLTVPDASGTITLNGHTHAASDVTSGTMATARLGSGTASSGTWLRGDSTWSSALPSQSKTEVFASSSTWTKASGAKMVHFLLIAGGGGGGSGRRGATSTLRGGGGGGSGGGIHVGWVDAANLGATETVTVGTGGSGGSNASDDSNGNAGTDGGDSYFGSRRALKGSGGGGGTSSAGGSGGAETANVSFVYGTQAQQNGGGSGSISGSTAGGTPNLRFNGSSTGGGGGGAMDTSNNYSTGGSGASIGNANYGLTVGGNGSFGGSGGNGGDGNRTLYYIGTGGGGARAIQSGGYVSGAGGNGALYGAGGGGGAGVANGEGNNAGGNGANGIVVITTYF